MKVRHDDLRERTPKGWAQRPLSAGADDKYAAVAEILGERLPCCFYGGHSEGVLM